MYWNLANFATTGHNNWIASWGIGYYGDTTDRQWKQCASGTYSVGYATSCYSWISGYYISSTLLYFLRY